MEDGSVVRICIEAPSFLDRNTSVKFIKLSYFVYLFSNLILKNFWELNLAESQFSTRVMKQQLHLSSILTIEKDL